METTVLCCICLDSVLQKHLFTDLGTRMKWATRLEELLRISVSKGDCSFAACAEGKLKPLRITLCTSGKRFAIAMKAFPYLRS